jgi:O-antigen ligase
MSHDARTFPVPRGPLRPPVGPPAARPGPATGRPSKPLPWDLLLVTAAVLILISVARLHSFIPALSPFRPALLVSLLAVPALLLSQRGARRIQLLRSPLGYAMAFIFIWATIGAPFALWPGRAVSGLTDTFFRTGMLVVVVAAAVRDVNDVGRLLKVYALGAIAFSVMATGEGFRVVGGGGYDPNDAALFVVSGIPLVLYFLMRGGGLVGKVVFGFGVLACGSAVVLSGSRGGFLALIAVAAFVLVGFKGIRSWVRVLVVASLAAVVSFSATGDFWERMESITDPDDYNRQGGRTAIWKRGMGYMAQNPLIGVGIFNFSVAEGSRPEVRASIEQGIGRKFNTAHSIWVQIGAELGVPGLIAMLIMFVLATRLLWATDRLAGGRRARGDPDLKVLSEMGRPLLGVLVAVAVGGSFLSHAYAATLWMPFALVLGVQKVLLLKAREHRMRAAVTGRPAPRPRTRRVRQGR